jgi:hypothetical protein
MSTSKKTRGSGVTPILLVAMLVVNAVLVGFLAPKCYESFTAGRKGWAVALGLLLTINGAVGLWVVALPLFVLAPAAR